MGRTAGGDENVESKGWRLGKVGNDWGLKWMGVMGKSEWR